VRTLEKLRPPLLLPEFKNHSLQDLILALYFHISLFNNGDKAKKCNSIFIRLSNEEMAFNTAQKCSRPLAKAKARDKKVAIAQLNVRKEMA
jgi:hypothetical protein